MRDLETISFALTALRRRAARLRDLHTNNARKTVDRMVDVFPANKQAQARTMLAKSLRGALAQLLLKKTPEAGGGRSRGERDPDRERGGLRHHPRRCDTKASGCDRRRERAGDAVHGRRHLVAAAAGHVSPQEAFMKAIDKNRFRAFCRLKKQTWRTRPARRGRREASAGQLRQAEARIARTVSRAGWTSSACHIDTQRAECYPPPTSEYRTPEQSGPRAQPPLAGGERLLGASRVHLALPGPRAGRRLRRAE